MLRCQQESVPSKSTEVPVPKLNWSPKILNQQIEPGVLLVFRLAMGIQWVLLSLFIVAMSAHKPTVMVDYSAISAWIEATFLWIYLSWKRLHRLLGAFYLPIALLIAAVEPVVSQAISTALNLQAGLAPSIALVDPRRLYIRLLLPMLLISIQYGYGTLLGFVFSTSCLSILLANWLDPNGGLISNSMNQHALYRIFIFTLAGVTIVLLSKVQRKQRRELAQKNVQLAYYATTLEKLTVIRERNRIARELHDTLAHTLSALNVQLKAIEVLWEKDPGEARKLLKQMQELTRTGLQESRSALGALRTSAIEELGLVQALQRLVEQIAERSGLRVSLDLANQLDSLRPDLEQQIYRIAEEAINNAVRHANARHIKVSLQQDVDCLLLKIMDDGVGFNPNKPPPKGHYGLTGMRERALLINGKLEIWSQLHQGTMVQLCLEL